MTTFQIPRLYNMKWPAQPRATITAAMITLPLLASLSALAGAFGQLPKAPTNLWFGAAFALASTALALAAWRVEGLIGRYGRAGGPGPKTEVLPSADAFVDRLERLTQDSSSVSVLDLSSFTSHLVAAPAFLSARCAPRLSYRQISKVRDERQFQNIVRLIRRSAQAERGSYYCVPGDDVLFGSTSFCVIERDDGFHVFLVADNEKEPADIVLVHDDAYGRFMLNEFNRLRGRLEAEDGPPLFHDGRLDPARESRLMETCASPRRIVQLRAA